MIPAPGTIEYQGKSRIRHNDESGILTFWSTFGLAITSRYGTLANKNILKYQSVRVVNRNTILPRILIQQNYFNERDPDGSC